MRLPSLFVFDSYAHFYCLIEYLEEKEKLEMVIVPNKSEYSSLLRKFVSKNKVQFLNNEKEKLEHKKR